MNKKECLNTLEWKQKRKEILTRDSFSCIACENEKLKFYIWQGKIKKIRKSNGLLTILNSEDTRFFNHYNYYKYKIDYIFHSDLKKDDIITFKDYDNNQLENFINKPIFLGTYDNNAKISHIPDYTQDDPDETLFYLDMSKLEVHHTYYQKGKYCYEYPNPSLQTFCRECHENFHMDNSIPLKNEGGKIIGELNYEDIIQRFST